MYQVFVVLGVACFGGFGREYSASFFLALVFGIRKARCAWGSTLTTCPKDFPSFRNLPKHLSKINVFSVLSSNMSYFDIYYFIDISFFAFC